jgi:hypothetical protein
MAAMQTGALAPGPDHQQQHCLKLIFLFVIYRCESDTGLQFDLQRRDFDLAGYFAGKTCMLY